MATALLKKIQAKPHTVETNRLIVSSTDNLKFGDPPTQKSLTTLLEEAGGGGGGGDGGQVIAANDVYAMFSARMAATVLPNPGLLEYTPVLVSSWQEFSVWAILGEGDHVLTIDTVGNSASITYSGQKEIIAKIDVVVHEAQTATSEKYNLAVMIDDEFVEPSITSATSDSATGFWSASTTVLARLPQGSVIDVVMANATSGNAGRTLTMQGITITVTKLSDAPPVQG